MPYELPALPYDASALEPHISRQTMKIHYTKHHQGYVDKLNALIQGTDLEDQELMAIVEAAIEKKDQQLFNNAAQVWNHNFFWNSMTPKRASPSDELLRAIDEAFDGMEGFNQAFRSTMTGQFGSGWVWLIAGDNGLEIMSTSNADLPIAHGKTALICCDVWEHAYYLDYQNERATFVDTFLNHLINWDHATRLFPARDTIS